MKKLGICTLVLLMNFLAQGQMLTVKIPAKMNIAVNTPSLASYNAIIKNKSSHEIEVKIVNQKTGDFISGFGLNKNSSETISMTEHGLLMLNNPSENEVEIKVDFEAQEVSTIKKRQKKSVSFTLVNSSLQSIPLIIPNVMNPNLSPKSSSGVELGFGQEIFFAKKGKKYLLLKVDETIQEGQKLDVYELLKTREQELNL
uniref:hypothetical protein n=1 Tax=Flavobacterium sp. TaxID=239 RepID=UPI00404B4EE6